MDESMKVFQTEGCSFPTQARFLCSCLLNVVEDLDMRINLVKCMESFRRAQPVPVLLKPDASYPEVCSQAEVILTLSDTKEERLALRDMHKAWMGAAVGFEDEMATEALSLLKLDSPSVKQIHQLQELFVNKFIFAQLGFCVRSFPTNDLLWRWILKLVNKPITLTRCQAVAYFITHLIFCETHWGKYSLSPLSRIEGINFLLQHLPTFIKARLGELVGESVFAVALVGRVQDLPGIELFDKPLASLMVQRGSYFRFHTAWCVLVGKAALSGIACNKLTPGCCNKCGRVYASASGLVKHKC